MNKTQATRRLGTQPRRLLVTGGAGFIGSHFCNAMVELGHRVVVLDSLTYAGDPQRLRKYDQTRLSLTVGDIGDRALVSQLLEDHDIDALVHFAAESHVDRSIDGPTTFISTNVVGTSVLLAASLEHWRGLSGARREDFRVVLVSTDEVFGTLGEIGRFTEQSPYAPRSPYSASKAGADHLGMAWHETFGLPVVITHCSNNYGPEQHPEKLIPRMITCAMQGEPLPVYGDGSNVRDWIHVSDHCQGVAKALELGVPGQRYCFGGDAERTNLEVVQAICRHLDRCAPRRDGCRHECGISFVTDRAGHDWRYAVDCTKAKRDLDFTCRWAFDEGLRETVQWYVAQAARRAA